MAGQRRGVGRAHLVMREGEIGSAALHGERKARVLLGDDGAFDVPAGPARSQAAAVPGGLPFALGTPQQGVERVLLAGGLRIAAALREELEHLVPFEVGRGAERGVDASADPVVHVAAVQCVGGALVEQAGDRLDHAVDGFDGSDVGVRGDDAQELHIRPEEVDLRLREFAPVHPDGVRPLEQRIVDVGDVLRVRHVHPGVVPRAQEHVEGDVGGGMTQVRRIVRRDAADVETRLLELARGVGRTAMRGAEHGRALPAAGDRGDFRG